MEGIPFLKTGGEKVWRILADVTLCRLCFMEKYGIPACWSCWRDIVYLEGAQGHISTIHSTTLLGCP